MAFTCAFSLLMILRVHTMWNRSKVILTILLLCYTVRAVLQLVIVAIFYNPDIDAIVATSQVLDYSFCTEVDAVIGPYMKYVVTWPNFFDLLLLILALIPPVKESIAMYKGTGRWEPNRYMSLIVKEGVAYLFLNLLNNIPVSIINVDTNPVSPVWYLIFQFSYTITMYPIFPRFVIGMRELFDKDSRGRLEGIDSAFGISSHSWNVAGRDHSVSGIAFVGASSHLGEEGGEEIQVEAVRGNESGRGSA